MDEQSLSQQFEAHRGHLRSVGYRMLGSRADADDAVQETWLRLQGAATDDVANLGGWLTTVMSRVCLDMLRARAARREDGLDEETGHYRYADRDARTDPEGEAVLADSVGVAMLVVLESLSPAERLAFVLHDMFAVSFDEIARIVDRSVPATRQLASRARRRVQSATAPPAETAGHTRLVQAFLSASRDGRFEDLLTLLAPDVVLGADERAVASAKAAAALGAPQFESELQGARAVAELFSGKAQAAQPVLVDGAPGAAWAPGGTVRGVFTFTITDGVITEIEVIAAPEQLSELDVVSH